MFLLLFASDIFEGKSIVFVMKVVSIISAIRVATRGVVNSDYGTVTLMGMFSLLTKLAI
jgi:hypothetical protein